MSKIHFNFHNLSPNDGGRTLLLVSLRLEENSHTSVLLLVQISFAKNAVLSKIKTLINSLVMNIVPYLRYIYRPYCHIIIILVIGLRDWRVTRGQCSWVGTLVGTGDSVKFASWDFQLLVKTNVRNLKIRYLSYPQCSHSHLLYIFLSGVSLDVTMAPRFLSHGQTFRAVIGDTLVLPCEVEDLGEFMLFNLNILNGIIRYNVDFCIF